MLSLIRYLIAVSFCLLPTLVQAEKPQTAIAVSGQWRASATAFARVTAYQQTILRLPFAARITALYVEPGASVTAGAKLAQFDAPLLHQSLANWKQALLEVQLAQKNLQILRETETRHTATRQQRVAGEQALARAQGKAQLQWETLAASLDLLHIKINQKQLEKQIKQQDVTHIAQQLGTLKAPFAGIIVKRQATLGAQLKAGKALFELEALQPVYLDVGVPAATLRFWQTGETCPYPAVATATADNVDQLKPDCLQPLGGVPLYDAATGLWLLRYRSDNPGRLLRDGNWIEVSHFASPRAVVWVPAAAVVSRHDKAWCVVMSGQQYKPVAVNVGAVVNGRVPVLSGLTAGDKIVSQGAYELLYRDLKQLIKFVD